MGKDISFGWELALIEFIQSHMGKIGEKAAAILSEFGEEMVLIAIIGFLYWGFDKKLGRYIGVNLVTALVWNPLIKNVFLRRRPYFDHKNIKCLKTVEEGTDIYDVTTQGFSFPSGHATSSSAVYASASVYKKKKLLSVICFTLIFLIGVSRFAIGVHYPTDVFCGWILGFLSIAIVGEIRKHVGSELWLYIILAATGIPGWFYCKSTDFYTSYGMMIGMFAAFRLEEKVIKFDDTHNIFRLIIRTAAGLGLFLVLSDVSKKFISSIGFDNDATLEGHIARAVRYAVVTFVILGVYPFLFKIIKTKKKEA